ncbi:uncharacterized protein LOC129596129 [Paramacrobiotus metropolitanus]|uniref:uncharacterized protein LOC129596129 n=1 Tax=Paramacrobiotus metropolitanus TaxID=2943436 RepID=UPI002445BFF8|nr:uncharacterized protein LOC129596129 [Paramacrobiotus metropolitanus]
MVCQHMGWLIVAAATLSAFLGTLVTAETCEELRAQCDELRRDDDGYHSRMLPPTANHSLWPVTAADLEQYRPFGDAYCRRGVDLGNCMKKLYSHCPEVYNDDKTIYDGWYTPEWHIAMGLLCNTTIGPVKLIRAAMHCAQQDRQKFIACCYLDSSSSHEQNGNSSAARQNICERLKVIVERSSGTEGTELGSKCGQDTMETINEGIRQLHAVYCSKP